MIGPYICIYIFQGVRQPYKNLKDEINLFPKTIGVSYGRQTTTVQACVPNNIPHTKVNQMFRLWRWLLQSGLDFFNFPFLQSEFFESTEEHITNKLSRSMNRRQSVIVSGEFWVVFRFRVLKVSCVTNKPHPIPPLNKQC